jgi:hypothetical protein
MDDLELFEWLATLKKTQHILPETCYLPEDADVPIIEGGDDAPAPATLNYDSAPKPIPAEQAAPQYRRNISGATTRSRQATMDRLSTACVTMEDLQAEYVLHAGLQSTLYHCLTLSATSSTSCQLEKVISS